MKHDYSLAHLTVLTLDPPAMIDAAAAAGYRYAGFRLNRTTPAERLYPLIDAPLLATTKARLASTGSRSSTWPPCGYAVSAQSPQRDGAPADGR